MKRDVAPREQADDPDPEVVSISNGRRRSRTPREKKAPPLSSMAVAQTQTLTNEVGERGLFATEAIPKGQVVVTFGGRAILQPELDALPPTRRRFALQIEDGIYLYSDYDGPGDWVNHSCAPNVGLRGQVVLVAMRRIEPGEEICFDYAMTDISDYDSFACACGNHTCRHKVSRNDWQLTDLQERYAGFFAPHVQRLINRE